MAFVVKKIDLDQLSAGTGTYTYEPDNITMTLNSFDNRAFQKAYGLILGREDEEKAAISAATMDDDFLNNINIGDKSTSEMITRAIAKFLIEAWDVVDETGATLEVTGDNLLLLTANTTDPDKFIQWVFNTTVDIAVEHAKTITDTKKKPSPATSGKKSTKASVTSKKP